ncbi:Mpo1-like protein [Gallaecimonas sp. GXIMD4217]|uniref:Mpo1 family 2-hydroxy fatty acid dioxygenase n=1 Tax=Gallaecimonas sp. GXIMD4217 TaxID=3131927 RepID=UPI00311AC7FC
MRDLATWFSLYGESHQNPVNKRIHFIAVPVIYFTVIALIMSLPVPAWLAPLDWALVALLPVLAFYFRLEPGLGLGMTAFSGACWLLGKLLALYLPLWALAAGLFVLAWIAQFVGHHIEGKRPSFFQDLGFLLIGPAWVLKEFRRK